MKGVFVMLDGIGDLPCKIFNGKTPLEAAETPNLDFLSKKGELGYLYSVKQGFVPESDEAIVSVFGNNLMNSTRGQLEARGADLKITRGDLAFRANFATIDSLRLRNIVDRRAGRTLTTKEAELLAKDLNKIKMPCGFVFKPLVQHRGVLIFKGGFSDDISGNDLSYTKSRERSATEKIKDIESLDESENSEHTARIVNEFLKKAFEVLDKHPVNERRKKKGMMPANYLLLRGPGMEAPKLKQYKKWLSISYMPLEIGFSKLSGMESFSFNYPRMRKFDVYHNLMKGLKKACKFSVKILKKNHKRFDYAYIHIKETDVPGHDNKPLEKKAMVEYLDKKLFKFLRKFADSKNLKILVTGDHSTPCSLKSHSANPTPVLLYTPNSENPGTEKRFCERDSVKGKLGKIVGFELLDKTGFLK